MSSSIDHTARVLLAQIYDAAARDELDEPARLAYAKHVGGARGRMIEAQLAGEYDAEQLGAWRAWLGEASRIVEYFGVEFVRGFWDGATYFGHLEAHLIEDPASRTPVVEAPAWGTVRRLHVQSFLPPDFVRALLRGPVHRSLRTLRCQTPQQLDVAAQWDGPFLAIRELQLYPEKLDTIASTFPALPELLHLHVHVVADLSHEPIHAMRRLADGPGTHSHISSLSLSVFGRQPTFELMIDRVFDEARRASAKLLRRIELHASYDQRFAIERDASGAWGAAKPVPRPPDAPHATPLR